jgi:hypothetical protein
MTKLLIVSASSRVLKEPKEPIEALQRFDGIFMRIIRKYYNKRRKLDILILSPVYGLVWAEEKIPYKKPVGGGWYRLPLREDEVVKLRKKNLSTLKEILAARKYDEIHLNVGKYMLELIKGFEQSVKKKTKITYSTGRGLGPKIKFLKDWLESQKA